MPFPGHTRPRGAGRSLRADSCGLPSPCTRALPSPGPPRRPRRRDRIASRCRCSPASGSQEPRAGPQRQTVSRAGRVHRPSRAPERGPVPPEALPWLIWPGPQQYWPPKGPPSRRKRREASVGAKHRAPTEAAGNHQLSPFHSLLWSATRHWAHPSKTQSRDISPRLHNVFKYK